MRPLFKFSVVVICLFFPLGSLAWGFWAHQRIAWEVAHLLPGAPGSFYLMHIQDLLPASVGPDKRRYAVESEGWNHYLDLDLLCHVPEGEICPDSALLQFLSGSWLVPGAEPDSTRIPQNGVLDQAIFHSYHSLTRAWTQLDQAKIIRYSGDLLHYLSDLCVPLHTTSNYNGALQSWQGIHALWESVIPETHFKEVVLFYSGETIVAQQDVLFKESDMWDRAAQELMASHRATENLFRSYQWALDRVEPWARYGFQVRGHKLSSYPSERFISAFKSGLVPEVEDRMKASVELGVQFLYMAWLRAGQPEWPLSSSRNGAFSNKNPHKMPNFDPQNESVHPGH